MDIVISPSIAKVFIECMELTKAEIAVVFLNPINGFLSNLSFWVSHKGFLRAHNLVVSDLQKVNLMSLKVQKTNPISSDFSNMFFSKPHNST